jgi:hypothetical protein
MPDDKEDTVTYKVVLNDEQLHLACRPGKCVRVEGCRQERHQARVPGLH